MVKKFQYNLFSYHNQAHFLLLSLNQKSIILDYHYFWNNLGMLLSKVFHWKANALSPPNSHVSVPQLPQVFIKYLLSRALLTAPFKMEAFISLRGTIYSHPLPYFSLYYKFVYCWYRPLNSHESRNICSVYIYISVWHIIGAP